MFYGLKSNVISVVVRFSRRLQENDPPIFITYTFIHARRKRSHRTAAVCRSRPPNIFHVERRNSGHVRLATRRSTLDVLQNVYVDRDDCGPC